jgi:hypothetical protein
MAWMHGFRKLSTRHDRSAVTITALTTLAITTLAITITGMRKRIAAQI